MREGWEIKKLGDIGRVSMCKRVFKEQTSTAGDIAFYKIGTFGKEPDAFISKEIYNEFRKKFSFPKKGDILILHQEQLVDVLDIMGNQHTFKIPILSGLTMTKNKC